MMDSKSTPKPIFQIITKDEFGARFLESALEASQTLSREDTNEDPTQAVSNKGKIPQNQVKKRDQKEQEKKHIFQRTFFCKMDAQTDYFI